MGTEISIVWKMDNEDEVARLAQALKLIKDMKALSELEDKATRLNKEVAELETKIAQDKTASNQLKESINELTSRRNELQQSMETQSESSPASAAGVQEVKLSAGTRDTY